MAYSTYTVQLFAIALTGFMEKGPEPSFPRWVCYFNMCVGVSAVGGGFATSFKTGPFAWYGLFAFWVPVVFFTIWIFVMLPLLRRAIRRQETAGAIA